MNTVRKIAVLVAASAVSFGLLGVSAPAHADSSWGYRSATTSTHR